jgi:hypothetical protein
VLLVVLKLLGIQLSFEDGRIQFHATTDATQGSVYSWITEEETDNRRGTIDTVVIPGWSASNSDSQEPQIIFFFSSFVSADAVACVALRREDIVVTFNE